MNFNINKEANREKKNPLLIESKINYVHAQNTHGTIAPRLFMGDICVGSLDVRPLMWKG